MENLKKAVAAVAAVLCWDVESNALTGKGFAIAGRAYDATGNLIDSFIGRCPIVGEVNPWVKENVLPAMEGISETHSSYEELLRAFFAWRTPYQAAGIMEVLHMPIPVEARVIIDAMDLGIIGMFEGLYNYTCLESFPEIRDSVDTYNREHGCAPDPAEFVGGTHNPEYDSEAAARAYFSLKQRGIL